MEVTNGTDRTILAIGVNVVSRIDFDKNMLGEDIEIEPGKTADVLVPGLQSVSSDDGVIIADRPIFECPSGTYELPNGGYCYLANGHSAVIVYRLGDAPPENVTQWRTRH